MAVTVIGAWGHEGKTLETLRPDMWKRNPDEIDDDARKVVDFIINSLPSATLALVAQQLKEHELVGRYFRS
jgi:hypothetical protein